MTFTKSVESILPCSYLLGNSALLPYNFQHLVCVLRTKPTEKWCLTTLPTVSDTISWEWKAIKHDLNYCCRRCLPIAPNSLAEALLFILFQFTPALQEQTVVRDHALVKSFRGVVAIL